MKVVARMDTDEGVTKTRIGSRVTGAGFAALFVMVWSSGYVVGGIGTRVASPAALGFWRFLLASVVLGVVSLVTRAPWPRRPISWVHLGVTGVLLQAVQFTGAFIAMRLGVPAGLAALIADATPLVVAAVAVPVFGETLRPLQVLGLVVGFAGVVAVVGADIRGTASIAGIIAAVIGLGGAAGGALYQKGCGQDMDLRTGTFIQVLAATAATAPVAALTGGFTIPLTFQAVGTVVWLALVGSIGAFLLLFLLLRRRPGANATSYLFLVPPCTALAGVLLLDQPLSPAAIAGFALATGGVTLVTRRAPELRT